MEHQLVEFKLHPYLLVTKSSSAQENTGRYRREADQQRNLDKNFTSIQKVGMPIFQVGVSEGAMQK